MKLGRLDALSGIKKFDDGAIIAQGRAPTKVSHSRENILQGSAFSGDGFQAFVVEKVATGIFRFGHPVRD